MSNARIEKAVFDLTTAIADKVTTDELAAAYHYIDELEEIIFKLDIGKLEDHVERIIVTEIIQRLGDTKKETEELS
jgi:glycyl-tRNA synthetase beta subunit